MNTQFQLQTFDKHQGWQTLETFAHLTDADAREHEIQESFTEQGLDVKTRVQRKPEPAQGNLAGMTKRQERNHFLVSERDLPAQGKAQHSPLPWQVDFAIEATFDDGGRMETVIEIMTDDHGDTPCYATSLENAKLIIASVNHADKLAEALNDCMFALSSRKFSSKAYDKANAALAAYEAAKS